MTPAAWTELGDAVVYLGCVWALPMAGAVGVWVACVGGQRAIDWLRARAFVRVSR